MSDWLIASLASDPRIHAVYLLLSLGYTDAAVDRVVDHLHRHGSVAGCAWVDPEDREWVAAELG